ncbi:MAG: FliH/SctL family protein [Alphaproteobacteria bacterium]
MIAAVPFAFAELGEGADDHRQATGADDDPTRCAEPVAYRSCLTEFSTSDPNEGKKAKPAPLFTGEDLASAVEEARRATAAEVEIAVRTALADDIERQRCELLSSLRDQIEWHRSAFDRELARSVAVSSRLAVALASAVIPKAIEKQPLVDITELVKTALSRLTKEPAIELRLPHSLAEDGEAVFIDLARSVGFAGDVTVIADSALAVGDVQIRWHGGAIDRCLDQLHHAAVHLADRWLREDPATPHDDVEAPWPAPTEATVSDAMVDPLRIPDQQMSEPRNER